MSPAKDPQAHKAWISATNPSESREISFKIRLYGTCAFADHLRSRFGLVLRSVCASDGVSVGILTAVLYFRVCWSSLFGQRVCHAHDAYPVESGWVVVCDCSR